MVYIKINKLKEWFSVTFKTNLFLRISQIKTDIELELISRRSVERLIERRVPRPPSTELFGR